VKSLQMSRASSMLRTVGRRSLLMEVVGVDVVMQMFTHAPRPVVMRERRR